MWFTLQIPVADSGFSSEPGQRRSMDGLGKALDLCDQSGPKPVVRPVTAGRVNSPACKAADRKATFQERRGQFINVADWKL